MSTITGSLSLISAAYAQQTGSRQGAGSYRQHDTLEHGLVLRERLWQNGVTEIKRIDPRTGEARDTEIHPTTAAERAALAQQAVPATLHLTAPIDLDTLRRQQAATVLSRDATTAPGRQ